MKDDFVSIYQKSVIYVNNNMPYIKELSRKVFFREVEQTDNSKINYKINGGESGGTSTVSSTSPGPLRVENNLLAKDSNNIELNVTRVIESTNKERSINGNLAPLVMNAKLNLSAEKKIKDMFDNQYFEHVSPTGVGVSDLGGQVFYEYILIGENLALGNFRDEESLLRAWMASPGHRANILNTHYVDIGVAVGKGSFEGRDVWMAVQHFGLPKSVCPSTDEVLGGLIKIGQSDVKDVEESLINRKTKIDSGVVYSGKTTNEQITEYNNLITKYNEMIFDLKQKINKYNDQVKEFNLCVEKATQ